MGKNTVKDVSTDALMKRFRELEKRIAVLERTAGIGRPAKPSPKAE